LRRTANDDLTLGNGVIFGTWRPQVPRDYLDMGKVAAGGVGLMIADASNNYRMWCVGAQLSKTTKISDRQNYIIEVATEDTDWAESTTNPTLSAIQDWYFCGSGYFGACSAEWSGLYLLNSFVIAGGSAAVPMVFDDIVTAVNNGGGHMPFIEKAGAAGTIWVPLRFGGGEACHVGVNLSVFQWPRKADGIRYLDAHISDNKHGIEFYGLDRGGGDVDTLKFTNTVFTSETPYYWRFNASHDADADIDFSGSTVVGATVTLRSTVSLSGVAFIGCPTFTQNAAVLTNCSFTGTKVTSAAPGDADNISNSTFTSAGTGYAIEIGGTAADITLTGLTFTGYAASDGSTGNEAIFVNIASGNMTISISGGNTPSIRTAGATVVVSNTIVLTLTGLVSGSDIVILDAGTTTERVNVNANSGTTYPFNFSTGGNVDICVYKAGYVPFVVRNYTLPASNASLPISQVTDRNYTP
jgi:hypothetical protein